MAQMANFDTIFHHDSSAITDGDWNTIAAMMAA